MRGVFCFCNYYYVFKKLSRKTAVTGLAPQNHVAISTSIRVMNFFFIESAYALSIATSKQKSKHEMKAFFFHHPYRKCFTQIANSIAAFPIFTPFFALYKFPAM